MNAGIYILSVLIAVSVKLPAQSSDAVCRQKIDSVMAAVYGRGQFTGSILVALEGKVIYEKAFRLADQAKNTPYTLETGEYIGSKDFPGTPALHAGGNHQEPDLPYPCQSD
jgi:hypothetical protein